MKKRMKKLSLCVLTAAVVAVSGFAGTTVSVNAATEHFNDASVDSTEWANWKENWDTFSSNYERVSLTPGEDESQLNYAWYCKTEGETPQVKIATTEDMSDAQTFSGTQSDAVVISEVQYYSNKVTVTGLQENTQYYYQVYQDGEWQDVQKYATKDFESFSFLYVGDPQIGASKGQTDSEDDALNAASKGTTSDAEENLAARNDSYNWNKILKSAVKNNPDVSFMISAGDQVNYSTNEREYSSYLGAEALTSLPVATTIGNHDSTSSQYSMHFNNPNAFSESETEYTAGKTAAGTDYYYTYGNTLFIVLDTNNYNCATHENVIKKAVEENPDVTWRVVTFHQDIYGSGADHSDSDGIVLRTQLTPLMDEYDIDVVLQGHDHTYSRTYQLQGDGEEHTAYTSTLSRDATDEDKTNYATENNCYEIVDTTVGGTVVNPEGTVYLEANSSTGSKYYNLIATQQDYISERSQTWTPTYSVVDVTDDSFSVTVYDSTTNKQLEGSSTYTIVKKAEAQETVLSGTDSYTKTIKDKTFALDTTADNGAALTYDSSDEDVAVVSKTGKVTITGTGTTTITVSAAETETTKAAEKQIVLKVNKADQKISAKASKTSLVAGQTAKVSVSGQGTITYSSSNNNVAAVSSKGVITAKSAGTAVITVKAAGNSEYNAGTAKITISVAPKASSISKISNIRGKKMSATWKKVSNVTGYQVYYYASGVKAKTVNTKSTSATIKNLKKGKTYKVYVRTYKTVSGKNYYSAWSKATTVKISK